MKQKQKSGLNQQIYVGPNLPGGVLQKYAVFRAGVPPHLAPIREKHPEIDELIVPVETLGEAIRAINAPGTSLFAAYQSLSTSRKGS